jgi:hypothetical protein
VDKKLRILCFEEVPDDAALIRERKCFNFMFQIFEA